MTWSTAMRFNDQESGWNFVNVTVCYAGGA